MNKKELLEKVRYNRKRYGKNAKETLKSIYLLVKHFPYYDGYEQKWLSNNKLYLK